MRTSATGAEIKEFLINNFPEGYYHEDEEIQVWPDNYTGDDPWNEIMLNDDETYDLAAFGYVLPNDRKGKEYTFPEAFNGTQNNLVPVTIIASQANISALLAFLAEPDNAELLTSLVTAAPDLLEGVRGYVHAEPERETTLDM